MAKFVVLLNIKGLPRMMTRSDSTDPMMYDDMRSAYEAGRTKDAQVRTIHGFQVVGWPYVERDNC